MTKGQLEGLTIGVIVFALGVLLGGCLMCHAHQDKKNGNKPSEQVNIPRSPEELSTVPTIGNENLTPSETIEEDVYNIPADEQRLEDVAIKSGLNNEKIQYMAMVVYFNRNLRIPNCVAYELTDDEVLKCESFSAERRKEYKFNADPKVAGCADWWEYKNSGYSRGHMAPAGDMKWNPTAMRECFYMTNICPQDARTNGGAWNSLEIKVRQWAKECQSLYVFTGPVIGGSVKKIGKQGDIAVPAGFFKVLYAPKQDKAIAFIYNNEDDGQPAQHAVTIREVERQTGHDFLHLLPKEEQERLENMCDIKDWR